MRAILSKKARAIIQAANSRDTLPSEYKSALEPKEPRKRPETSFKPTGLPVPTEDTEQRQVVQFLDIIHACYFHVPNGGKRGKIEAAIFKGLGVKKGVPDIIIIDSPPNHPEKKGTAIEMKRRDGVPSDLSPEQKQWLTDLQERGWLAYYARGAGEAINILQGLGYGKR